MLPAPYLSQLAEKAFHYFGNGYTKTAKRHFEKIRPFIDKFLLSVNRQGKILDIGCGPGFLLEYLASRGFESLLGIDVSEAELREAQKRVPTHQLLKENFHRLNFYPKEFSTIFAINSLQYTTKQALDEVLKKINKIINLKGRLFIVLPEGSEERITEETYVDPETKERRQHAVYHSYYTQEEIASKLKNAGFTVISSERLADP
ncbi:hypothetical protein DRN75_03630, partial [Nanoarchaeota archaeon]